MPCCSAPCLTRKRTVCSRFGNATPRRGTSKTCLERARNFLPEEEIPGRDQVAILSQSLWQNRFGADPQIVGKTIVLDGKTRAVIGVMPPKFRFPGMTGIVCGFLVNQPADICVPLALAQRAWSQRGNHYLQII